MSADFLKQGVLNENYRISAAFTRERLRGTVRQANAFSDGTGDDAGRVISFDGNALMADAWVKLDSAEAPE